MSGRSEFYPYSIQIAWAVVNVMRKRNMTPGTVQALYGIPSGVASVWLMRHPDGISW